MKNDMNTAPMRSHQRPYEVHAGMAMSVTYATSVTRPPVPRAISVTDSWDRFMSCWALSRSWPLTIVAEVADDEAGRPDGPEDSGAETPAARDIGAPVHLEVDARCADE